MPSLFEFRLTRADSPFWAVAPHDGHQISPPLAPYLLLDDEQRLREEDPYTACMAELPVNQLFVGTSRFQLDINRAIDGAVYLRPDQAWGLQVWKEKLPEHILQQLYQEHEQIYTQIDQWIQETIDTHGFFVVFDVHSYNAKRESRDEVIDAAANPQVNLGTHYNKPLWRPLIEEFIKSVSKQQLLESPIDIRENVKFKGGNLAQHLTKKFGDYGCVLSVEFRKDFMDEWTGLPYMPAIQEYKQLMLHALKDLQENSVHGNTR